MRFEYIVLLIIAFNVITALLQRRAKKARAEAAARGTGAGSSRTEPEWYEEEDEEEIIDMERPYRDDRQGWEDRRREAAVPVASGPDAREAERMPSMGRDILDQIARDLGLKVPRSETPAADRTMPNAPRPDSMSREHMPKTFTPDKVRSEPPRQEARPVTPKPARAYTATDKEYDRLALMRTRAPAPLERAFASKPLAPVGSIPPVASRSAEGAPRPDLKDPRRLREAFIVKEILDLPLSRRIKR
jgi:hypothetical protein